MNNLDELIERVERATAGDRGLDALLWLALVEKPEGPVRDRDMIGKEPPVTSSIDAAIGLVGRALPGWCWRIGTCCVSDDAWLAPDLNCPVHGPRLRQEMGRDAPVFGSIWDQGVDIDLRPPGRLPIAIILALLTVLRAKENGGMHIKCN